MRVTPYIGVTSLTAKQVRSGPVKRKTCKDFLQKKTYSQCSATKSRVLTVLLRSKLLVPYPMAFWGHFMVVEVSKKEEKQEQISPLLRGFSKGNICIICQVSLGHHGRYLLKQSLTKNKWV